MSLSFTRRRILAGAIGAGGACLASAAGLKRLVGDSRGRRLTAFRMEGTALGTTASIVALHADEGIARSAAEAAFRELALVESLMSIYRPDSQLSRLNAAKVRAKPHPYLTQVLLAAGEMSRLSDGAFDATVQPLWETHARADRLGRAPTPPEIAAAKARVDWRRVEVSQDVIRLHGGDTSLTLNGIAQGFATDRALAVLADHGAEGLVSAGELAAHGRRSDGEPWRVGIQHPRRKDAYAAIIPLEGRRLATSGDYATTFSDEFRRHHVFDPRTGVSPSEFSSVSILAPTALQADALSTAVFVMGAKRGWSLIQTLSGVDAYFVLKNGRALATESFPIHV